MFSDDDDAGDSGGFKGEGGAPPFTGSIFFHVKNVYIVVRICDKWGRG